ncbi:Methyl-accepting chemotaxis sensor/transducer protein [hydrothermal vent metagenome]|uniref:Methyl-accepting chemotaxis sensor/transducer protein n=1 Tax=hydrothermal vent metagenome TaxID=652676 RepID=A0A3B0X4A5_9ZZZZ
MKTNLPVNNNEVDFPEHAKIISTTDLKGAINYLNQDFIDISGFSSEELQTKNHNIVRHPDMPPAAFQNLWDTIKQGKPWMGIVKNRCKNGDFYWVDAYVTPVYNEQKIIGYQSVRSKPNKDDVSRASTLYKRITSGKKSWFDWLNTKLINKLFLTHLLTALLTVSGFAFFQSETSTLSTISIYITLAISTGLAFSFAKWHATPWQKAARQAKKIFDNSIARQVYTGRNDELACLQSTITALQAKLDTVLVRVDDSNTNLVQAAAQTSHVLHTAQHSAQQQQNELSQLATALEEMTAAVREVATSATNTSELTQLARDSAKEDALSATEVLGSMDALMTKITETVNVIQVLESESSGISTVVEVIRDIAEQTNLLALNAAIEAARAGEQGRGFAVVADEVRSLAQRTQSSTQEIEDIVKNLQTKAADSASMMNEANEQGIKCASLAKAATESLGSVAGSISNISDNAIQIAIATEEQTAVAEEINRNVNNINQLSIKTSEDTCEGSQSSQELLDESESLKTMIWQFA